MSWTPIYICGRPDTKSKKLHAACHQYDFYSTEALVSWLRARRNSTERVIVTWCPTEYVRDEERIVGTRTELSEKTDWPA